MTKRNERTSKRIAMIAGRILALERKRPLFTWDDGVTLEWADIRSMAASALTQARDRDDHRIRFNYFANEPGKPSGLKRPKTVAEIVPPKKRKAKTGKWFARNGKHRAHLAARRGK